MFVIRHTDSGCLTETPEAGKLYLVEDIKEATKYQTKEECQGAICEYYNRRPWSQDNFKVEECP